MKYKGYTVAEQIDILAGAIRSRAREHGKSPAELTRREAATFADAQNRENPGTIAAAFYRSSTDRQWTRVYNRVISVRR